MAKENRKDDAQKNGHNPEWERFKKFVQRVAAVPKDELDEQRARYKREKKKRAG